MPSAKPSHGENEEPCNCGRWPVFAKGDLKATCPECHSLPDYCECKPPRAATAVAGGIPPGITEDAIDSRILPGGCILDEPETPPAVWGDGDAILWAEG